MSLHFIAGRAGSGKTTYCLNKIVEELEESPLEGAPLILLVPEQITHEMEKTLLNSPKLKGIFRAQVLSFERLAYRVLQEAGGSEKKILDELGKKMIIRRLLNEQKKNLVYFQNLIEEKGFTEKIESLLTEFKHYCIKPDNLESFPDKVEKKTIKGKLQDVKTIYVAYEEYLGEDYLDPDDYLDLLVQNIEDFPYLKGAEIFIDGFNNFTLQQYEVIRKLMSLTQKVHLTLTVDTLELNELKETDLFYNQKKTYLRLSQLAQEEGIKLETIDYLKQSSLPRWKNNLVLQYLEENYFAKPIKSYANPLDDSLELRAAANLRAEVEAVARKIIYLTREKGLKYKDIGILIREMNSYGYLLETTFQDYHIPYFIGSKLSAAHHPLVELVKSICQTFIDNWHHEPLFQCLKTDLFPVTRLEVDRLENYCLAFGLRKKEWLQDTPWEYVKNFTLEETQQTEKVAEYLQDINTIREKVKVILAPFASKMKNKDLTVAERTFFLFDFLESIEAAKSLELWQAEAEAKGDWKKAREHALVWKGIIGLLEQLVEALGKEKISLRKYQQILEVGLDSLTITQIPPVLDQVVIYDLNKAIIPELKASFILGLNEGVYPPKGSSSGIFTESEKDFLGERGLELAPTPKKSLYEERYLLYHAFTRGSEYLWLSYALADSEGKSLLPANLWQRLKYIFKEAEIAFLSLEPGANSQLLDFITIPNKSLSALLCVLRDSSQNSLDPEWMELYNYLLAKEVEGKDLRKVCQGFFAQNKENDLSYATIQDIYQKKLKSSVSQLENYRRCPFSYFLRYGLKLTERNIQKISAPDLGQFFHAALQLFGEKVKEQELRWKDLGTEERELLIKDTITTLAPKLQNEILLSSNHYKFIAYKLENIIRKTITVLTKHEEIGEFYPFSLELSFGENGDLPPLEFELEDGEKILLSGRIDRVDVAVKDELGYFRVIDYKSGNQEISVEEIYHGLTLQLLAYLFVLENYLEGQIGKRTIPAGMLYYTLKDPIISTKNPVLNTEELEKAVLKELKMKGFLLKDKAVLQMMDKSLKSTSEYLPISYDKEGEPKSRSNSLLQLTQFQLLFGHLEQIIKSLGAEILQGKIAIEPCQYKGKKPCTYCPYKAVCQFDLTYPENKYRVLPQIKDLNTIWTSLEGGTGDGAKMD